MAEEMKPSFGPYELVPGVNSLSFGSDPVLTLEAGKSFSTEEPAIAAFLDESPQVVKAEAKPARKPRRPAAAASGPPEPSSEAGGEA